jgi:Tfp pilus assembly protein PilF
MIRAVIAVLVLCAVALAQAPDERIDRAIRFARNKQYAEARRALAGVPAPADRNAAIAFHRLRAAIASGLGEHRAAALEMREGLALAPGNANLLLATAVAERQAGLLDDALAHAEAAAQAVPGAQVETLIGDLQEARGKYVEAANAFKRAVELAPADEQARLNLALELVRHHTFEPAVTVLEQAAAAFPRSTRIRTLLGVADYAIAKTDEAVASLIAALDIDPSFTPAREYLARITLDAQTPDAGAVNALCKQRDGWCTAVRLRANREDADAFADLQRTAKDGPLRCELARAYEWREQWTAARTEMEACVRSDPANPQHHYQLARIYQRLGLDTLAHREAELQKETTRRSAEELTRREQAVQAFQVVVKP